MSSAHRVLICGHVSRANRVSGLAIALADLAASLGARGWNVDLANTPDALGLDPARSASDHPDPSTGAWRFLPRLRALPPDVRRVLQHMALDGGMARAQSDVIAAIDRRLAACSYDAIIAVVLGDGPGLAHFVTHRHPRVVLLSFSGLASELRLAPWLRVARTIGRVVYKGALHPSVYRPVDPGAVRAAVFASESWREEAVRAGLPARVTRTVYFGLNRVDPLPELRRPSGRLLWVGRLSREKGLHTFLDAIARLRRTRAVALTAICGAGPRDYRAFIDRRVAALALSDVVEIRPAVPRAELPAIYRAHDALLFQSVFAEPVALVLMEAFAAGLPVVAPQPRGPNALVRPDETCIGFASPAAADVAAAISRALDDDELRRRVRREAHDLVQRDFSAEAVGRAYDDVLTGVIN